jgi:phosphatidylglycerophosphatase A
MTPLAIALASALGVGYAPVAPGTFGSLVGLVLWFLLPASIGTQLVVIAALFVAGSWSGTVAEQYFKRSDPSHVVIDEVMGMLITLVGNPVGWRGLIVAFFLFRIFDIVKPYPARRLERLHGGIGIMADDAMAGVYANLVLRVLLWIW